jgi:3'-phosphoadenosine 5'-phosphosulfate sulfotransferase (PAPS reductase)/FAD synthetase
MSTPLGFWLEDDIWDYIKKYDIPYAEIYDLGYTRTGCMFCMFGVQLEKGENRFQCMKKTHPKQYDYCINKLGCGKVLDFIAIEY